MSTIRVNAIQNTTTTDGGISIDSSGHVTVEDVALPSAGPLSNRNLVINGAMRVAQRGTSQASLTDSPQYLVDRFAYRRQGTWGTNSFTMSQQSSGAPDGFTHFLRLAQSGTAAAPPTDTWCGIGTYLEGNTVYQAGFGTSAAQPLTLSFWVKASEAGTYSVALSNGSDQTFIHEYSVTSSWNRVIVPITARTTGTWATDNTSGFLIHWVVAADSDGTHSASTGWNATLDYHGTNQIETFASTSGATFDLAGVQLEVGEVATPFEHRSYGDELARCQRYYCHYGSPFDTVASGDRVGTGYCVSSTSAQVLMPTEAKMRTDPSVSYSGLQVNDASVNKSISSVNSADVFNGHVLVKLTTASGLTAGNGMNLRFNSASDYISLSAEL